MIGEIFVGDRRELKAIIDISKGVSEEPIRNVHKHPAATMSQYGKGYITAAYGAIPRIYCNNHHPFMRAFIGDIIQGIFKNTMVKTDTPYCVDLSLRRSVEDKLCIHLLNLSNMPVSERRAYEEFIPP